MLLHAAIDDYTGLYEAVWELNSSYPEASLGEKYDAAESALRTLLSKGLVALYKVNVSETMDIDRYIAIETSEIGHIVQNPVSWYPDYNGERIVFAATDERDSNEIIAED